MINDSLRIIHQHTVSFSEAIQRRDSESFRLFFHQKYGPGVRFLIRRYRVGNADAFLNRVINATFISVLTGAASREADLPPIIHRTFRLMLREPRSASGIDDHLSYSADALSDLASRLKMFKPHQIRALVRFYVQHEDASSICQDLRLLPEEFRFICNAAKEASRLTTESVKGLSVQTNSVIVETA